jgi:hypothetical protein
MLTTETLDQAICLLEEGSTYLCITQETGITREEAEAVARAYDAGQTERLRRELVLAEVLETAAAELRSGDGFGVGTVEGLLRAIERDYPKRTKAAVASQLRGITQNSEGRWHLTKAKR